MSAGLCFYWRLVEKIYFQSLPASKPPLHVPSHVVTHHSNLCLCGHVSTSNSNLLSTFYKMMITLAQLDDPEYSSHINSLNVSISAKSLCHICCSVTQLCLTLCDPMDCSTPGFPVLHHLPELTQTHVHWVSDAIHLSCPLLSPSPPALNLSQDQGLLRRVRSSHQVAKVLELLPQSF